MKEKQSRPFRHLLIRPLLGRFAITDAALTAAERILPTYRGPDGDHEGIAFLLGFETPFVTVFTGVLAPEADHGPGHVFCSRERVLESARAARAAGASVLGQIHSHPGAATLHSGGDDEMALMPFEGMLSIVAPYYGHFGLRPLDSLGVHQLQSGQWALCERQTVSESFVVLPARIDLR